MPKFSTSVPHKLGKETAKNALHGLVDKIMEKFKDQVSGFEQSWSGDTLNFNMTTYGFKITGSAVIDDQQVKLQGDLPFAAAMFKGKIESTIQTEVEKALKKAEKA
jgi:putative polyhydroxyalkanoate system protein